MYVLTFACFLCVVVQMEVATNLLQQIIGCLFFKSAPISEDKTSETPRTAIR